MWEQLQLTYSYGVDKLWILNVGDLKPMVKSHILYPPLLHPAAIFFHALNIVNMNMGALGDLFRGHMSNFTLFRESDIPLFA